MFIFLDIDGVLNTSNDWQKLYTLRENLVNNLCNSYPNSKIILISSWMEGFISRNNPKNSPQIKNLENILSNNVSIIGKIENTKEKRDIRIQRYIEYHNISSDYIIIDDDKSEYSPDFLKNKHLYIVNSKYGFQGK